MTRLEQLIEESRRLAPASKRNYLGAVRSYLAFAGTDPRSWTPASVDAWARTRAQSVLPDTVNLQLKGLKWASNRRHEIDGAIDFAMPIETFRSRHVEKKPPRALTTAEIKRMFAACYGDAWEDKRDAAMLALGFRLGLRRFEIANLRRTDWQGKILKVRGKGGRIDDLEVDPVTQRMLARWRDVAWSNAPSLYCFWRKKAPLGMTPPPLTPDGVYKIFKTRAEKAHVHGVTPHMMRHSFISHALAAGVPPWRVQVAARHGSSLTTHGYTHDVSEEGAVGGALPDPNHDTDEE